MNDLVGSAGRADPDAVHAAVSAERKALNRCLRPKADARASHQLLQDDLFDDRARGGKIAVAKIASRQPLPVIVNAGVERHPHWNGAAGGQGGAGSRQQPLNRLLAALQEDVDMMSLPDAGARLRRLVERIFVYDRHLLEMPRERRRRREPGHAASGHERRLADLRHPPQPLREEIRLPAKGA